MELQDLVGRPLVPFFDSEEKVNDLLQFPEGGDKREEIKVDARVWDKNLGYFVYPSDQQMTTSTLVNIAVKSRESRTDSGSKLLLTPSMMLSSGVPVNSSAFDESDRRSITDSARPHSSSVKRGLKPKTTRSSTLGRRRKESEGGAEDVSTANAWSKKGKNKGSNTNSNGAQCSNNQQSRNGKQKEQLSASGKWAWSAFQSSPDPTELPLPPFLIKTIGCLSNGNESFPTVTSPALSPPRPPPTKAPQLVLPAVPPMPTAPPELAAPPEATAPDTISVELSMTQDLRKMLNIGDQGESGHCLPPLQ
ncbi:unnamed protein product [Peronospora belbahrii]|uniref:Uncharacterized protein n=1 Tax=Peronospora belbahrii TaxID=622444 RepID=A0AAU9LBQ9_9STRA|nr:unnamed protein product [Peronospora belbahrii]